MKKTIKVTLQLNVVAEYDEQQTTLDDVVEQIKYRAADLKPETIENSVQIQNVSVDFAVRQPNLAHPSPVRYVEATKTVLVHGVALRYILSKNGCRDCVFNKTQLCDEIDCIDVPEEWGITGKTRENEYILIKD